MPVPPLAEPPSSLLQPACTTPPSVEPSVPPSVPAPASLSAVGLVWKLMPSSLFRYQSTAVWMRSSLLLFAQSGRSQPAIHATAAACGEVALYQDL